MTSGYLVLTLKPDECILLSDDVGRILAEVHLPKERTTNERLAFRARSDIHISRAAVAGTRIERAQPRAHQTPRTVARDTPCSGFRDADCKEGTGSAYADC